MTGHPPECAWHVDQYPHECTCGLELRKLIHDAAMFASRVEVLNGDPRLALQASEVFRRLRCFASAIEARRAAASDAVHESAVPQADAQVPQPAADLQPSQVDSHNHGPDNTSDRTDITGGSFES